MASSSRGEQLYEPETPYFARTILPELLCLGKLEIPKAFVRKYGRDLLNSVQLKIPTGETWTVELEKDDERVWLGRGWKNLMARYSILANYSIAFGFLGNSTFDTFICDEDGYHIDYPIGCSCCTRVNCKEEFPSPGNGAGCSSPVISIGDSRSSAEVPPESETPDEVDRDFAAFLSATPATQRSDMIHHHQPPDEVDRDYAAFLSATQETQRPGMVHRHQPPDEVDRDYAAFLSATEATERSGRGHRTRIRNGVQAESSDEGDPDFATFLTATRRYRRSGCARNRDPSEAFVAASMFTSYNPFFLVEVQTTSVAKGIVTEGIMERCDLKSGSNAVTIEYQGWLWTVTVKLCGTQSTVCLGWKAFMRNISLKVGDVCVLELVARKRFKVAVFRCMQ